MKPEVFAVYAKAFYAGLIAALGSLSAIMVGDFSFADVTAGQWVTIVLAGLVAFGGVAKITNADPTPPPA